MKRILKWVASLALTVAVAGTTFLPAMTANAAEAEGTEKVYTTSCDMAKFIYQGYYHCDTGVNPNSNGPIAISKAKLVNKNVFGKKVTKDVYIVGLAGTEFMFNEPRGVITDLQVGFEQDNFYIREIRKVVCKVVPKGANVIFTGHSLGGMVAQQAAGDRTLKHRYNIINTISFGSPQSFVRPVHQIAGLNREDGGYAKKDFAEAHMRSYLRTDVWGDYDVLGFKGGSAKIIIDEKDIESYGAYIIPLLKDLPRIDMSPWS